MEDALSPHKRVVEEKGVLLGRDIETFCLKLIVRQQSGLEQSGAQYRARRGESRGEPYRSLADLGFVAACFSASY